MLVVKDVIAELCALATMTTSCCHVSLLLRRTVILLEPKPKYSLPSISFFLDSVFYHSNRKETNLGSFAMWFSMTNTEIFVSVLKVITHYLRLISWEAKSELGILLPMNIWEKQVGTKKAGLEVVQLLTWFILIFQRILEHGWTPSQRF